MKVINKAIVLAVKKGYHVDCNGNVFYKNKQRVLNKTKASNGRLGFKVRVLIKGENKLFTIPVHRLVAYQKFGNKIFKKNVHVRHLDGNHLNNKIDNIQIGTPSQNEMDKSSFVRMKTALRATSFMKKHNHKEIVLMRNKGMSYEEIMKYTGIKSKGTISFIINSSITARGIDVSEYFLNK